MCVWTRETCRFPRRLVYGIPPLLSVSDHLSFSACDCPWPPPVPAVAVAASEVIRTEIHEVNHARPSFSFAAVSIDRERWVKICGGGSNWDEMQRRWNQGRGGINWDGTMQWCSTGEGTNNQWCSDAYIYEYAHLNGSSPIGLLPVHIIDNTTRY